jgi:DnaJ-class molecular chaperone
MIADASQAREVLGVPEDAGPEEIRAAYRTKILRCHPDKEGKDATEFMEVKEAYNLLTTTESEPFHRHGQPLSPERAAIVALLLRVLRNLMDRFYEITSRMPQQQQHTTTPANREPHGYSPSPTAPDLDVCVDVRVDFADVYRGAVKKMVVNVLRRQEDGETMKSVRSNLFLKLKDLRQPEQVVAFRHMGDDGPNDGERGDVYVTVSVTQHPDFCPDTLMDTDDLHMSATLSMLDYFYGTEAVLKHVDDTTVKVVVPPWEPDPASPHSRTFVVAGLGMLSNTRKDERGDLHVCFRMAMPTHSTMLHLPVVRRALEYMSDAPTDPVCGVR